MKYFTGIFGIILLALGCWFMPKLYAYPWAVFGIGVLAGGFIGLSFASAQKEKIKTYKRQLEKVSVISDADSSKVEVLEAKIRTLEAALKQSLENK